MAQDTDLDVDGVESVTVDMGAPILEPSDLLNQI